MFSSSKNTILTNCRSPESLPSTAGLLCYPGVSGVINDQNKQSTSSLLVGQDSGQLHDGKYWLSVFHRLPHSPSCPTAQLQRSCSPLLAFSAIQQCPTMSYGIKTSRVPLFLVLNVFQKTFCLQVRICLIILREAPQYQIICYFTFFKGGAI